MRLIGLLPCSVFFLNDRLLLGSLLLVMEIGLLLVPMAVLITRHAHERTNVDRILGELSASQLAPAEIFNGSTKFFRRV